MLPPALMLTLMWSEAVPLLLALVGSCTTVYASLLQWGMDIIYHNLFWVGVCYGSTIDCIDKQLIAWGHFFSANLYYIGSLPLSTALMMEGLLSSIRLNGLLAGSTRAVAFGMPGTFLRAAFADGVPCRAVVMARGV